ncbi:hypothetical protein GGI25_006401 [Coemansia spiralis]|uniref:Lipid storage droplets surface-binding protein 1 n=2 Tax=Coemansia TaxID=4863 RepID=A0A9W8G2M2_9FUNG|nr:hypothetical protein BX070DRAFT_253050 [Coemansia spiralis]KAJ1987542.1 hypothetical protein EDC05_005778 [Coemansia umbellata]KAJ2619354.1 hypothetical protein GGI26_005900 [Coemansia sp. RSA 1358]KAJ2668622.1 hypothetical protein GGI25_006401 [Coemansia spiralis]
METAATPPPRESTSSAAGDAAAHEDSRSETSTADSDERPDLSSLTFFTRLYEIPVINDAVSSIYRIAESNKYTLAIIGYAEKVGGFAEKSRPLLKPVEKPIVVLDGYATRSLEIIESKYPIVNKPTNEVIETVQTQAKAVESKYPIVARTFAVAKSTANSALDRVDYLIEYVLPPAAASSPSSSDDNRTEEAKQKAAEGEAASSAESEKTVSDVDSPLGKVTIIVHKLPQRLGQRYYQQLQNSKSAIGGLRQSVKDTVNVYESEISGRSQRLLESVQERVKTTLNTTIPSYLPQFAQPYYEYSKDVLTTKVARLHAEYLRTDEDARTKVLNLILISGEQVPVLEGITMRIFGKATGSSNASAASSPLPSPPPEAPVSDIAECDAVAGKD